MVLVLTTSYRIRCHLIQITFRAHILHFNYTDGAVIIQRRDIMQSPSVRESEREREIEREREENTIGRLYRKA